MITSHINNAITPIPPPPLYTNVINKLDCIKIQREVTINDWELMNLGAPVEVFYGHVLQKAKNDLFKEAEKFIVTEKIDGFQLDTHILRLKLLVVKEKSI